MTDNFVIEILNDAAYKVERELECILECSDDDVSALYEAMAYSTLGGGKRIRAFLVLEFCKLLGGDEGAAIKLACALEMVHAFSLIHDDLPCMDDDDMRRGKPSCHIKYGEAHALIAGDALIMLAFETAASASLTPEKAIEAVKVLARCAGALGMCGGQAMDMYAESHRVSYEYLKKLQSMKTGALIECAAILGCICADSDEKDRENALRYASLIGRAFQIVDDVLDVEGDEAALGKNIGSDAESDKTTFVTELGLDGAKKEALKLTEQAARCLDRYEGADVLRSLAFWLC